MPHMTTEHKQALALLRECIKAEEAAFYAVPSWLPSTERDTASDLVIEAYFRCRDLLHNLPRVSFAR
jgi:hypothetical protein